MAGEANTGNDALEERITALEGQLERSTGVRTVSARTLTSSYAARIARSTNVAVADVDKVLGALALEGLEKNIASSDLSLGAVDEGRLVLTYIASRRLIFA